MLGRCGDPCVVLEHSALREVCYLRYLRALRRGVGGGGACGRAVGLLLPELQ